MEIEKYDKTEKLDKVEKLKKQDSILKENSKNRNIIAKLTGNPSRLAGLKESFKYFSLLKKNVYLERKQFKPSQDDIMVCNCIQCPEDQVQQKQGQASYNCGERCINKYTCTECDVDLCPCGLLCKNRRFQKHEDACVYPFKCGGKGMGLSAGEKILKGQFIMQYIGEIFYIKSALGRRRVQEYSRSTCTYLMKINNLEVIDPTYKGNLARFINHSCEPNCITMKWNVLGEVCIGIFANRDIEEDEELTFDYQFDAFNTPLTKCLCGAKNCKGYLGLKPTNKSQEEWDEHLENMVCGICSEKTPFDDEMLLLCDKCNCGFHMNCLQPPLVQVPKDAWFCSECLEENRLEDEKEKEREKFEGILQQKLKQFKNDRKKKQKQSSSEESSDSSESYNYDQRFKQFKQLETETIITQNERIVNFVHDGKSSQLQQIVDLAYKNFIQWFEDNQDLNQKIQLNQLQKLQSDTIKVSFRVNIIEQKLVKKISNIIYMIGNKTSFEQIDQQYEDFFKKENDLTVIGTSQQTEIFSIILLQIESIVKDLKQEMGIIEGQIRIPIIFLRRLISQINQLEKIYEVNIIFNKNLALSEEIFALDKYTPIKIKGAKQNIENCVQNIDQIMENLQIQRLYLSRSETKTVQQNLYNLKNITEIRISRDQNFKFDYYNQRDINHPFYYIQYREKEVCLIGTFEQIQESISYIKELLLSESHTEKEMTYFTILIPPQMKEQCKNMKSQIEKMFAQTKVLLFEPSHPRKNITILVLCLKKQLQTIRQQFHQLILNSCEIQIDKYQDQMMMQMCRYVYKYLQNMIMTEDIAFMKNWDIISPYFSDYKNNMDGEENWFVQKCHLNLQRDAETQLYIQQLMHEESSVEDDENSERKKQIVGLIKRVLTNAQTQIKSLQESDNLFGDDDNQQVLDGLEQLRIFPSSKSQSMSRSNSNSKSNEKSKSKTQSQSKSKSKTKSKTKSKSISKSISKSKSRPNEVKKNILYSSSDDQNQQSSDTESDDSSSSEQIRSMFKSFDPHLQDTFKTQQNEQKSNKQDENITSFQYKKQELIIPIIDNNLKSEQNGTSNQKFKITSLQIPQKSDSDDSQNSKSPDRRYRQDYRYREKYDKYRDYKSYNRNYNRNYKSRNDVKNERSNYRRNDYEKVYYKRNDSNDQFERSDRNDKYEKYERYDRHDKYDKDQRYDKYEKDRYYKNHKNDKIEKSEKSDKQEKSDKPDRSERNDRYDKYERYRYDDRNRKYNRYDRQNDRQERYEEKSQNRYNRQRNEKYMGSNIKQVDLRSEYKAKPRYRYESHYKNQRSESSQSASSNSLNSKQKNRQNRYYRSIQYIYQMILPPQFQNECFKLYVFFSYFFIFFHIFFQIMQQERINQGEVDANKVDKPKVVFILGVPCSGKGTLCYMIQQKYQDKVVHLSAGDLLRAERNVEQSEYGQLINDYIKEGKIVPSAITVQLLKNAMTIKGLDKFFLIDGFPRNYENLQSWNSIIGPSVDVIAVLNLVCSFETLWQRLCLRRDEIGRIDDNEETLKKRLNTHNEQTMPIIKLFEEEKKTFSISTETSKREVYKTIKQQLGLKQLLS